MNEDTKKSLTNIKKAQSHINKVIEMMEEGKYCIDVMQQNLAVIGLLKLAHRQLMEGHLSSCFKAAMETGNKKKKQEMTKEILQVTSLYNR